MQTITSNDFNPNLVPILSSFRALSDPIRLQIVELLRSQELCVCDLCELLSIKQPKLSFHLKILKDAQLLHSRQDGRWVYYSLNLPQWVILQDYLAKYRCLNPINPANACQD
ncbi:transcriptional regulator, ArsR family [Rippkaea orientalis PCC 8801]|uniref:Transcriptional regulator, ArsR family n=1 Tax=Rippkaea orientalis (strain PCC 8801 / RF-1) TaxID=41431 RepID=B7K1E3_RIPO1|nr:metalloregulator ArsR/SmtB family transcription factor [Rippkaea orientalis]ACK66338.1 transcriptional regulator, ArsR family [Rippkaea orientalis PCC 8801]